MLRITPKNANNIFVADYKPGTRYKKLCFQASSDKTMLTDEECNEYEKRIGRTIVPIHHYKGDYEKPVVLIRGSTELSFDEVEIVDIKEITRDPTYGTAEFVFGWKWLENIIKPSTS